MSVTPLQMSQMSCSPRGGRAGAVMDRRVSLLQSVTDLRKWPLKAKKSKKQVIVAVTRLFIILFRRGAAMQKAKNTVKKPTKRKKSKKKPTNTPKMSNIELKELVTDHKVHKLTLAELKFVGYFIYTNGNKTEAICMARPDISRTSAAVIAAKMLKKERVQDAIDAWRSQWFAELKKNCKDKAARMLATMAFYDPLEIIDESGFLKRTPNPNFDPFEEVCWTDNPPTIPGKLADVELKYRQCIEGIERKNSGNIVKLVDRKDALRHLAEYLGLFESTGNDQPTLTDETAKQLKDIFAEDI